MNLRSLFQPYDDSYIYNRFGKTVDQATLDYLKILIEQKDLWERDISLLDRFEFNLDRSLLY